MAKIEINEIVIGNNLIVGLMDINFKVDIHFESLETFNLMVNNGFEPELWEIKNNQKVLVGKKHYTEY